MQSSVRLNDAVICEVLNKNFRKDGFVFLQGFLNAGIIKLLTVNVAKFINEKVKEMPPEKVCYEDLANKSSLKQLQEVFRYAPFFNDMMFGSDFEKLASILLADEVKGKK